MGIVPRVALAAACLCLGPAADRAEASTHFLTCGREKTVEQALRAMRPGDTLLVTGTCDENVVLGQEIDRITLDGRGTATINGDSTTFAVTVRGRGITIRGFTITGGLQGIAVLDGGSAVIDGNTIPMGIRRRPAYGATTRSST
jgi:nitrous oxidase accessory protein NosD